MTGRRRYVVIGSGPAGTRASETFRKRDRDAQVVVVGEESYPFYNRIPLSKEFLESDEIAPERVVIKPRDAYEAQGIALVSGVRAERIDPDDRRVSLSNGETLEYDGCVVATGSTPVRLPVPGMDLAGVHTLRTLEDAVALRAAVGDADRAVVVGGGLIGMEVASCLAKRGVPCTLVARERWLYGHLAPPEVGDALMALFRSGGVDLALEITVTDFETEARGLSVRAAGGRTFPADVVVVGVGVRPNIECLEESGLTAPEGVRVDRCMLTAAEGLAAAGDVAAIEHPVTGVLHRVEHWLHAQQQGRAAAENLLADEPTPFERVSSYDTTLFGVRLAVVGAADQATAWTLEGHVERAEGVAYGSAAGRLVAAFALGAVDLAEITTRIERDRMSG